MRRLSAFIVLAALSAAVLAPTSALAWNHCGTPQAEPDCEAHGLPGKPKPAPEPAPAPPVAVAPAPAPAAPSASTGGGGPSTSTICLTTETETTIHVDTVRTTNANAFVASHPGAVRLSDMPAGNCGPTDLAKSPPRASIISLAAPPAAAPPVALEAPPVLEEAPPVAMVPPVSMEAPPAEEVTPDEPFVPEDLGPPDTGDGTTVAD